MSKFLKESQEILKINTIKANKAKIALSFLSTTVPLIAGHLLNQLIPFIVATLLGHFLFLSDSPKALPLRLRDLSLHGLVYMICLFTGILLHNHIIEFVILFCIGVYILAISINISKEVEMSVLLCLINLILGFYSSFLSVEMLGQILIYNSISFIYILSVVTLLHFLKAEDINKNKTHDFQKFSSTRKEFHLYGVAFSFVTLLSFIFIESGISERPYWIIITLLVILKPELRISFHRMIQRTLGTILGVIITSIFLHFIHDMRFYLCFIGLSCLLLPSSLVKNYWLGTTVITMLVVTLLSLPTLGKGAEHLSFIRLTATLWGVAFALLGSYVYQFLKKLN